MRSHGFVRGESAAQEIHGPCQANFNSQWFNGGLCDGQVWHGGVLKTWDVHEREEDRVIHHRRARWLRRRD